ncbi:a-factor receptor [Malassezia brasiliensis]|uniref:A-factor receptor n=1 Tax=Malassezia brasiliensis TaxID=1821822 RepID=A0AAF0DRS5_9BASI|nr:a-factor receptor [Malassezia brasiliensis]
MSDVALPIFNIISVLLTILPTPLHWRARNFAILLLIVWLTIGNLNTFINRTVWMKRSANVAPVWCDISVKLMSLVTMGIISATFCIAQKLKAIASMRRTNEGPRFQLIYEICLCFVLPLVYTLLTFLSQGHRFNIIEGQGCSPAIFLSPISIIIDYGIPLTLSLTSIIYSLIALKHFLVHKHDFQALLEKSGSALSTKTFLRMISFTLIDLFISFPVLLTEFTLELLYKKAGPYTSWDVIHHQFSRVVEYPAYVLDNSEGQKFNTVTEMSAWAVCTSGIIFFLLFGFSIDARADYVKVQQKLKSWVSRLKSQTNAQR